MSRTDGRADGAQYRGLLAGFSPLAGVTAGTAGVLFAFGVLLLAWHQVSGHVSLAITMLTYAVIAALAIVIAAGAWLAVLWVAQRHRNPELLVRRADRVQVAEAAPPAIEGAAEPRAIEPPRVYLNVTPDQLEAILRADHEE